MIGHPVMNRTATISMKFDDMDCTIEFVQPLEVSLDCYVCQRRMRTVILTATAPAYCTPTKHEFDAQLLAVECNADSVTYTFEYTYIPFTDAKYPEEQRYASFEKGSPAWVRVYFIAQCPKCGKETEYSTQSNIVRPRRQACSCGHQLFIDRTPPQIIW